MQEYRCTGFAIQVNVDLKTMRNCSICTANIQVLGIEQFPTSEKEIKEAYRDAAKVWHPDRFQGEPRLARKAEEQFKRIQNAYQGLTDHARLHGNYGSESHEGKPLRPSDQTSARTSWTVEEAASKPAQAMGQAFFMPIEDVFSIVGRGTIVVGRIRCGQVKVGQEVEIVDCGRTRKTIVIGVEMFNKKVDEAMAGDNVGLLLKGIGKGEVEPGMALVESGST